MKIRRIIHKSIATAVLHAALAAGAALFAAPFVWLAVTSAKAPDELYPPRWKVPTPAAVTASPYTGINDNERAVKPIKVDEEDWARLRDALVQAISRHIEGLQESLPGFYQPYLADIPLAEGVFTNILRRTPDEIFRRSEADAAAYFQEAVLPDVVQTVFERIYRRLALADVVFVGWDMHTEIPADAMQIHWEVVEGDVRIVPRTEGLRRSGQELHYRFDGNPRFAVQTVLPLKMPPESLKKFRISNHQDRSWHPFTATIELNGQRWRTLDRPYLRAQTWQDSTWQFVSDEDRSVMVKTWLTMGAPEPSDFNAPGQVRITLSYRQASPLMAAFNKYIFNYTEVLRRAPLWRYIRNSFLLVVLNILGQVLGSSLVAFAFARLRWPGREFCFLLVLATLMVPPQVTLVPVFLIFKQLGWYNTLKPLWVPAFFGSAFYIFLLRQFMRSIPADLEDSAKIDGCGYLGIYARIILPLIKPALAAIAIFTFMAVWNDFMGPLIFITDQELYPLSLGLFALHAMMLLTAQHELMMAAAVLMTLPVIALFFAAQRHFIQGITLTGLKG